jgi:hypothetical protein
VLDGAGILQSLEEGSLVSCRQLGCRNTRGTRLEVLRSRLPALPSAVEILLAPRRALCPS